MQNASVLALLLGTLLLCKAVDVLGARPMDEPQQMVDRKKHPYRSPAGLFIQVSNWLTWSSACQCAVVLNRLQ